MGLALFRGPDSREGEIFQIAHFMGEKEAFRREVSVQQVHQDDLFKQDEQTLLDTMDGRICWLWALGH